MVWSCPSPIHDNPQIRISTGPRTRLRRWWDALPSIIPGSEDYYSRWMIRLSKWAAVCAVSTYIIITERQVHDNYPRELPGDKDLWSFSQTAALLLALTPLWPLIMALIESGEVIHKRALTDRGSTFTRDTESLRSTPSVRSGKSRVTPGSDAPPYGDGGESSPFLPLDMKSPITPREPTYSPEAMFSPEQRGIGKAGEGDSYPFPPSWKSSSDTALPRQRKAHQASSSTSDVYELEPLNKE